MKNQKLLSVCVVAMLFASAQVAFAGPIIFFDNAQFRYVFAGPNNDGTRDTGAYSGTVTYTSPAFSAVTSQSTEIGQTFIGGTGFASTAPVACAVFQSCADSQSSLSTTFFLDEPYLATLFVSTLSSSDNASAYYSFSGANYIGPDDDYDRYTPFTTTLLPGYYSFMLAAIANGTGTVPNSASFNGGLTLAPLNSTPVPEPATMTMLGLGLAVTGAKRWRNRCKRSGDDTRP